MAVDSAVWLVINGIARGLIFALLGAGITLVFGLGSVLNLALGVFAVVAVIATDQLTPVVGNPALASLGGLLIAGGLGLSVDRTLLTRVYRAHDEQRILLGIFVTLGLAIFLEGILYVYYPLSYSVPIQLPAFTFGELRIRGSTLAVIAIASLVLGGLFLFLDRTFLGKATRTVFQDEDGALLCGIDPRRIQTLVFVLSVGIVGVAGILQALDANMGPADAFELTIFGIIVSIVGGVRNIRGTIVAGVLLGLVITFGNAYIGSYISQILLFLVAIGALVLKPEDIA